MLLYLMIPLALLAITIAIAPVLAMTLVEHRFEVGATDGHLGSADRRDRMRTAHPRIDRSGLA